MKKIFWFLSLFNAANGLWMLFAPYSWYRGLPAGIPDTGPPNLHFVRDLGAAFLTLGLAFCFAAPRAARHRNVVLAATAFYLIHALIHAVDLVTGRLAPSLAPRSPWRFSSNDRSGNPLRTPMVGQARLTGPFFHEHRQLALRFQSLKW